MKKLKNPGRKAFRVYGKIKVLKIYVISKMK